MDSPTAFGRRLLLAAFLLLSTDAARADAVCLASVTVERNWIAEREADADSKCDFNTELLSNVLFAIEDNHLEAAREVRFAYRMTVTVISATEQGTLESREIQESRELAVELDKGFRRIDRREEAFAACKFGWKHVTGTEQPVETVEIVEIVIGDVVCSEP